MKHGARHEKQTTERQSRGCAVFCIGNCYRYFVSSSFTSLVDNMIRVYEFTATSLDYGQLLIRYEYSEADPSVGLDETYDWFAFEENTNKDVTYELDRDEQKYIFKQVKQHYKEVCEDFSQ